MFNKAAVLVANDLDTISGVYLGSLFQNKPKLVFDAHEYFTQVPELINRKFKQKIWQWIEYIFVPKMDLCYTVNESLAHIFKQNLTIDFQVIQNCPEYRELASSENTATEKYILYQGALNKGRGLEQLIAAMQNVAIKLKIAGDGDLAAQLKKQVKALELEKKVQFLGNLKYDELQLITQNAWIGVNLLENESLNYFYSLANKFFDYAHAEIPQIGMQFPEYIRLNNACEISVLIAELDVQSIQKAIANLQDQAHYMHLKANTITFKQNYNWQNEEKKLIASYQKLLPSLNLGR